MSEKPTTSLIVMSSLVILFCLVLLVTSILAILSADTHDQLSGGVLAIPVFLWGLQQYRGTFRSKSGAATMAMWFAYSFGGLTTLGGLFAFREAIGHPKTSSLDLIFFGTITLLGLFFIYAGWVNSQWRERLLETSF